MKQPVKHLEIEVRSPHGLAITVDLHTIQGVSIPNHPGCYTTMTHHKLQEAKYTQKQ